MGIAFSHSTSVLIVLLQVEFLEIFQADPSYSYCACTFGVLVLFKADHSKTSLARFALLSSRAMLPWKSSEYCHGTVHSSFHIVPSIYGQTFFKTRRESRLLLP